MPVESTSYVMQLPITLLLLALQSSQFEPPVTVRCELDTELPLEEIRVSIAQMREREGIPKADGGVTLSGLLAGDIDLSFYQRDVLLGDVKIRSANQGEFIRLKIRLVTGNAILVDEFRIKGVSEDRGTASKPASFVTADKIRSTPRPPSSVEDHAVERSPTPVPLRPAAVRPSTQSSSGCPEAGAEITRTGKLARIIDKDSFELEGSDGQGYAVYVGSATRLKRRSALVTSSSLEEGMRVLVKGTVAAGPEDECSIGAREVIIQRQ